MGEGQGSRCWGNRGGGWERGAVIDRKSPTGQVMVGSGTHACNFFSERLSVSPDHCSCASRSVVPNLLPLVCPFLNPCL